MSVRELRESQKVMCKLNLYNAAAASHQGDQSNDSSILLTSSDDAKIDLWTAEIEVYEVVKPSNGDSYRLRCLHKKLNLQDGGENEDWYLPILIMLPHYETRFFGERIF